MSTTTPAQPDSIGTFYDPTSGRLDRGGLLGALADGHAPTPVYGPYRQDAADKIASALLSIRPDVLPDQYSPIIAALGGVSDDHPAVRCQRAWRNGTEWFTSAYYSTDGAARVREHLPAEAII